MVLIYSHITSPRLQYTCNFIFKELLGVEFTITIDSAAFKNYEGVKLNYSDAQMDGAAFSIKNTSLLFEEVIVLQPVISFNWKDTKAFFQSSRSDFPFDIFAATFYLLSRYEEYLPHGKDGYGRYAHENSLAFREGFLQLPLINIWVKDLAEKLVEKFPFFSYRSAGFSFQPTYDIDIAYSYKHKGLLRNTGGFLRRPSAERIQVLLGSGKDPFDAYGWLDELHHNTNLQPIYFFLVAQQNGQYDKNILPHKEAMWRLVKHHAGRYSIGLHPSWQSGDNNVLLKREKDQLEAMSGKTVTRSRQHYIRFNLPRDYRRLAEAGITDDYSMGYGSINGFRASVASSFYWYDLEKEQQTPLRVHPFCYMDANSFYEQQLTPQLALEEMLHYYGICRDVGGNLVTIWHNNFLGTDPQFKGWAAIYRQFIARVQQ